MLKIIHKDSNEKNPWANPWGLKRLLPLSSWNVNILRFRYKIWKLKFLCHQFKWSPNPNNVEHWHLYLSLNQQETFLVLTVASIVSIWLRDWSHQPLMVLFISISDCNSVKNDGPTSIPEHKSNNFMVGTGWKIWCDRSTRHVGVAPLLDQHGD